MSVFLSPSTERNLCLLVDKRNNVDSENGEKSQEKVKIWVSKELLAAASPVFNTMFYGDFRENQMSSAMEPIYFPGKNDQDFIKFLDCLFPYPTQSDIGAFNVETIVRLANEYQVEILLKKCDQYYVEIIQSLPVGSRFVLVYLPIIVEYKLKRALETCIPFVAALDMDALSKNRSQNMRLLDGYHQFYAAVYEAKLRRILHEQHKSPGYGKCIKCNCDKPNCCKLTPSKCLTFHTCQTKSDSCVCGYEFDSIYLDL